MNTNKTIKEWFETINDEDVRQKALKYMEHENVICESLADAVMGGFYWISTYEGGQYWARQYEKAERGEL